MKQRPQIKRGRLREKTDVNGQAVNLVPGEYFHWIARTAERLTRIAEEAIESGGNASVEIGILRRTLLVLVGLPERSDIIDVAALSVMWAALEVGTHGAKLDEAFGMHVHQILRMLDPTLYLRLKNAPASMDLLKRAIAVEGGCSKPTPQEKRDARKTKVTWFLVHRALAEAGVHVTPDAVAKRIDRRTTSLATLLLARPPVDVSGRRFDPAA